MGYICNIFLHPLYPGIENIDESLPERTTLQRKMKKYLLDGKKFGVAKETEYELQFLCFQHRQIHTPKLLCGIHLKKSDEETTVPRQICKFEKF